LRNNSASTRLASHSLSTSTPSQSNMIRSRLAERFRGEFRFRFPITPNHFQGRHRRVRALTHSRSHARAVGNYSNSEHERGSSMTQNQRHRRVHRYRKIDGTDHEQRDDARRVHQRISLPKGCRDVTSEHVGKTFVVVGPPYFDLDGVEA